MNGGGASFSARLGGGCCHWPEEVLNTDSPPPAPAGLDDFVDENGFVVGGPVWRVEKETFSSGNCTNRVEFLPFLMSTHLTRHSEQDYGMPCW